MMKKERLLAEGNIIKVTFAGLYKSEFFCLLFYNDKGQQVHREKVSRIEAVAFTVRSDHQGLFKLVIQNDKTENVYEKEFFVNRSVNTTYVGTTGEIVFHSSDLTEH